MSIATSVKEEAKRLIEELPDNASWEDLMYQIHVRQAVETGLRDVAEGRMVPDDEARRQLGSAAAATRGGSIADTLEKIKDRQTRRGYAGMSEADFEKLQKVQQADDEAYEERWDEIWKPQQRAEG